MGTASAEEGPDLLSGAERRFLSEARRAVLATVDEHGGPRLVPICFVTGESQGTRPALWTPIDEKPKRAVDPMSLARVRDIRARPRGFVLVDRWDEDWSRLGWLRLEGAAEVLPRPPAPIVDALREKYPQYRDHALEGRPVIRITIERVRGWGSLSQETGFPPEAG